MLAGLLLPGSAAALTFARSDIPVGVPPDFLASAGFGPSAGYGTVSVRRSLAVTIADAVPPSATNSASRATTIAGEGRRRNG